MKQSTMVFFGVPRREHYLRRYISVVFDVGMWRSRLCHPREAQPTCLHVQLGAFLHHCHLLLYVGYWFDVAFFAVAFD